MSPLTILLAEDNIVNQKIIKEQFELDGHKVYIANDGKEAIEKFDEYEKIEQSIFKCQKIVAVDRFIIGFDHTRISDGFAFLQ